MCTSTVWRGNPASSLAPKAACKVSGEHQTFSPTDEPIHVDSNGVRFIGTGLDSRVLIRENGAEVPR